MDKRILVIGCILAVAILIDVSFTSVVGYSSNNSNSIRASPLFKLRTNRAIENGEDVTTCDYVGKGKGLTIPILERDNLNAIRQQLLDKIKGMNEKELKAFKNDIIRLMNQKGFDEEINNANQLAPAQDFTYDCDFTSDGKTPFICKIYNSLGDLGKLIIDLGYVAFLLLYAIIFLLPTAILEFVFGLIGHFISVLFGCKPPSMLCRTEWGPSDLCWTKCYTCWTECICQD